jgi:hypothetical protein
LLLGSSSTQLSTLSGTTAGQVPVWSATGFTLGTTGSGLPAGGSDGHVLIKSGSGYNWVAIDPSASVNGKPFTFTHSSGGIQMNQSSPISVNSGGLGQITPTTGALYILENITTPTKFIPLTGSPGQMLAWDGGKWAVTDGFSRQAYTGSRAVNLPVGTVVALSGTGLNSADFTDILRSNAFGVIQASSSGVNIVQTSNEVIVAFSSSTPAASVITGSVFYVSSSGTASLYSDITGTVAGRYATQIGYLNRKDGANHFIILQPRVFGLVY